MCKKIKEKVIIDHNREEKSKTTIFNFFIYKKYSIFYI